MTKRKVIPTAENPAAPEAAKAPFSLTEKWGLVKGVKSIWKMDGLVIIDYFGGDKNLARFIEAWYQSKEGKEQPKQVVASKVERVLMEVNAVPMVYVKPNQPEE